MEIDLANYICKIISVIFSRFPFIKDWHVSCNIVIPNVACEALLAYYITYSTTIFSGSYYEIDYSALVCLSSIISPVSADMKYSLFIILIIISSFFIPFETFNGFWNTTYISIDLLFQSLMVTENYDSLGNASSFFIN